MSQVNSKNHAVGKSQHKYNRRRQTKYVSPGNCLRCLKPGDDHTKPSHSPRSCRNPPFCNTCDMVGHATTAKCKAFCSHCMEPGHSMRFCRKIKVCVLCMQFPVGCTKQKSLIGVQNALLCSLKGKMCMNIVTLLEVTRYLIQLIQKETKRKLKQIQIFVWTKSSMQS